MDRCTDASKGAGRQGMVYSVSQFVEPQIVNFSRSDKRQFDTASLKEVVEQQDKKRFESIDDVKINQFAKNYNDFYKNQAADFSVEEVQGDRVINLSRLEYIASKIFRQADTPGTTSEVSTDEKVSAQEVHDFIDKADFLLNQLSTLMPESDVMYNQFVYFATKLNDIYTEIDEGGEDLNLYDFAQIVKSNLDIYRADDFDKVLDVVSTLLEDNQEYPVVFNAYV